MRIAAPFQSVRTFCQSAAPKFFYAGVIALLLGALWLGHRTHWSLGIAHAEAGSHGERAAENSQPMNALGGNITELSSDLESLDRSGIELGRVESQPVESNISVSGMVSYNQNLRAELASRVPGHVWRIEKHAGETIRKGDVLAIIDASDVGKAKGDLLKAIVLSEAKAITFERLKNVQGAVTGRQLRDAEVAAREAKINADVCVQNLVNMGLPLRLEELTALNDDERVRHVQFLGLTPDIIASLEPTTTSNLIPLRAPFDGVVIGRDVALGEVVSPDKPQFEVCDISKVWVLLDLRKEHMHAVKIGQEMTFQPDGTKELVKARIDWINSEVDEVTRTLQVRAEVANPRLEGGGDHQSDVHLLRANSYGIGTICIQQAHEALVVPTAAVQFDGRRHMVFVRDGSHFTLQAVELGEISGAYTEIRSGVSADMEVACLGSHVLKAQWQLLSSNN